MWFNIKIHKMKNIINICLIAWMNKEIFFYYIIYFKVKLLLLMFNCSNIYYYCNIFFSIFLFFGGMKCDPDMPFMSIHDAILFDKHHFDYVWEHKLREDVFKYLNLWFDLSSSIGFGTSQTMFIIFSGCSSFNKDQRRNANHESSTIHRNAV